jgi:ferrous iron transport protein B
MVTPLMSCSARLPVYVLLISFVVPDKELLGFINLQGLVMFCLYLTGFVTALLVAFILKLFIRIKETGSYIAELPIYRKPRWGNVLYTILEKVKVFVWDAGKVIVFIAIVLWFLASYGPGDAISKSELQVIATQTNDSTLESKLQTARLNASYAGHMGKWIEPLITPLGFDWKIGIAIITSFAAREVFVGTMATIYSVGSNENPDFDLLRQKMSEDINVNTGGKLYTTATGLSLIMFYVFAMQCMSTLAIVRRETKSWKWPWIQFMYLTVLAWVASFITYTLLS